MAERDDELKNQTMMRLNRKRRQTDENDKTDHSVLKEPKEEMKQDCDAGQFKTIQMESPLAIMSIRKEPESDYEVPIKKKRIG